MKKFYLSRTDKKLNGLCGGIATYFGVDSSLVRLLVIFISLVTALVPAIITYIIAGMIIPHTSDPVIHDVK